MPLSLQQRCTMKRSADRQITKDDREEETEDVPPPEGMPRADEEAMKKRRIVKVARNEDGAVIKLAVPSNKDNPLASVQLVAEKKEGFGFGSTSSGFGGGFGSAAAGFGTFGTSSGFKGFGEVAASSSTGFGSSGLASNAEEKPTEEILPTSYDVKSGEEDEEVLFTVRCKSYRFGEKTEPVATTPAEAEGPSVPSSEGAIQATTESTLEEPKKQWIEVGVGPLKLLHRDGMYRIVQRRQTADTDPVTKLLHNIRLYRESTITQPGEKQVQVSSAPSPLVTFKCGTAANASQLFAKLQSAVEAAKVPEEKAEEEPAVGDKAETQAASQDTAESKVEATETPAGDNEEAAPSASAQESKDESTTKEESAEAEAKE